MKRLLLIVLPLLLIVGCSSTHFSKIVNEYDEFNKTRNIYQKDNWVLKNNYTGGEGVELNLFLIMKDGQSDLYLKFHLSSSKWLFIRENDSFKFLFTDGEVLTLSADGSVNTDVLDGGHIKEWGVIQLDSVILKQLLSKELKSLRVIGKDYHSDYNTNLAMVQKKWGEFSKLHLVNY